MNRIFPILAVPGLLLSSVGAFAQNRSSFYSEGEYQLTHTMFARIQNDLNHAQAYSDSAQASSRFDLAKNALKNLEQNWQAGKYDSRQMDTTFSAVQAILDDTRLVPRDRDALSTDASSLLEFRTEYYG